MSTFQIDFGGGSDSKIVGIDLGTTNSLVAVMDLTGPRILSGIVPSVVFGKATFDPATRRVADPIVSRIEVKNGKWTAYEGAKAMR